MAMSKAGALRIDVSADTVQFDKGISDVQRKLASAGKRFEALGAKAADWGKKLSIAATLPIAGIAAASIKGAQSQAAAMAQVDAAIKSMGNSAKLSGGELSKFADQLELKSLFDADEILKSSTANLLTFGNIAGDTFKRAQQAAVDLATRMDGDLQGATLMVGKALNDPVKGLTALSRAGIQFTEQQKEQIKAMAAAGDTAGAQAIMLAELEKQFGGAAAAAAQADPMREVMVKLGQAGDVIGEKLLPLIPPLTTAIVGLLDAFTSLSPEMQTFVIGAGAVAAAVGPILVGLGGMVSAFGAVLPLVTKLGPVFSIVQGALVAVIPLIWGAVKAMAAMALTPVGAVITAIALAVGAVYLAWKNWDKIEPILRNLYNGVKTWIMDRLGAVWEWLKGKLLAVGKWFYDLYDAVVGHSYIPDMVEEIGQHIARLEGNMVQPIQKLTEAAAESFRQLQTDVAGILSRLFPTGAAIKDIEAQLTKLDEALAARLISPQVWAAARDRLSAELQALRDKATQEAGTELGLPSPEQRRDELDVFVADVWEKLPKLEEANEGFAKSFEDMARRVVSSVEGLIGAIKGGGFFDILDGIIGVFGSLSSTGIFGSKAPGIFDGIGGLFSSVGSLFGGGGAASTMGGISRVKGLANGGSFKVGGNPGIDRNMLAINGVPKVRVSANERVTVSKPGQGAEITLNIVEAPGFASKVQYAATGAAVNVNRAASAQMARQGRQRLA